MSYDVIVIGGGPAGSSAAVALGRALRSVLLVDAGNPRNAPAEGIHNFLTRDAIPPAEFGALSRAEVTRYGGEIVEGTVTSAGRDISPDSQDASLTGRDRGSLSVTMADGRTFQARRLLVTTGLTDELPDIPGLRARWGHQVIHCPYCHGYEVRGQAIGVIGTSPISLHQAQMWRQWSDNVTYFQHTGPAPEPLLPFTARGIRIVPEKVVEVLDDGVRLGDGSTVTRDALVVAPRFLANAGFLGSLGLEVTPNDFGTAVAAAPDGRTAVPGVWVAGNVTDPMAQVISAAAGGLATAAALNMDLITEETATAAVRSASSGPASEAVAAVAVSREIASSAARAVSWTRCSRIRFSPATAAAWIPARMRFASSPLVRHKSSARSRCSARARAAGLSGARPCTAT
jgi:thioredoxin reductase